MVSGKVIKAGLILLSIASGFLMPVNIDGAISPPVKSVETLLFFLLSGYFGPIILLFIVGKNPNISICHNNDDSLPLNPKYPTLTIETGSLMAIGYYFYPTIDCMINRSGLCLNGFALLGLSLSIYLAAKTVLFLCKLKTKSFV